MSLRARLAAIGIAVLAGTVAVVALLGYELSRVQGRAAVDEELHQDLATLRSSLPGIVADEAGGGPASVDDLAAAARRYLATHPGNARRATVIRVGGQQLATGDGPDAVVDLIDAGGLPDLEPGELRSVPTEVGLLRVLAAPLTDDGGAVVGTALVVAPLSDVLDDAGDTLARIALAGAVGVVLGAGILTLTTGRALAPLRHLADVARSIRADDLSVRAVPPGRGRSDETGVVTEEFNRMLDRIAADGERRQRLLAAISHELRTPVAVARGHLEVFDEVDVGVLRTELQRLSRLVDDLSAFARGSLGAEVELSPVFVPDLFDDLGARLAGLGLGDVRIEPAAPVVIEGDQDRLAQCLLNLVDNAATHTPPGTAVEVSCRVDGPDVVLEVADRGPGIDPAVADRAFEPFVTTRRGGGARSSGLGLAVVRVLTEAQGGTVTLATSPAGTTVALRFPSATASGTGQPQA